MKFLTPDIEKLLKIQSDKSLAKQGVSCGIFQDCFDSKPKQSYTNIKLKKEEKTNGK